MTGDREALRAHTVAAFTRLHAHHLRQARVLRVLGHRGPAVLALSRAADARGQVAAVLAWPRQDDAALVLF